MAGWSRSLSAVLVGSSLALAVAAPVEARPPRGGLVDVTDTAVGRRQVAIALERRAERGERTARADLRVLRFAAGAYVVAPRGLSVRTASVAVGRDGQRRVRVDVDVSASMVPARSAAFGAQVVGPAWQYAGGGCFDVLSSAFGYSVSCYELDRVVSDGTSTRDFWALEHWSTTGPDFNSGITANAKIYDAWIAAVRANGSPAMSWMDWSPRGDKSGSCQPIGLTVTVLKLPLTGSYEMCEQWDMTWSSDPGRFRNQWRCGCFFPFGVQADREVAYTIAVSVPNGTAPSWVLSQGFLAW